MSYEEWSHIYPTAARELQNLLGALPWPVTPAGGEDKSEAWAQQQVRMRVSAAGAMAWRNNVGALPAKCPSCGTPQDPVRYGLANDSPQLNAKVKSSDLILAIPRIICREDIGRRIAQFGAIEVKRPGWVFEGRGQEPGQAAWLALIKRMGGFAAFSTGDIQL